MGGARDSLEGMVGLESALIVPNQVTISEPIRGVEIHFLTMDMAMTVSVLKRRTTPCRFQNCM